MGIPASGFHAEFQAGICLLYPIHASPVQLRIGSRIDYFQGSDMWYYGMVIDLMRGEPYIRTEYAPPSGVGTLYAMIRGYPSLFAGSRYDSTILQDLEHMEHAPLVED